MLLSIRFDMSNYYCYHTVTTIVSTRLYLHRLQPFAHLYTCLTREYRGGERWQILRQCGLKPTRISGFFATVAAGSIKSWIACGYEYTATFQTCQNGAPLRSRIPEGYIPKKVKQNASHGAKKPGENLFSCYPEILLILLFLVCII